MRQVSNSFKSAFFGQETGDCIIALVTIEHSKMDEPIYLSSDPTEVLSNGERGTISNGTEYQFFPFDYVPPNMDGESIKYATFVIDNVSRELVDELRSIRSPLQISVDLVLSSDPDVVEIPLSGYELRNTRINSLVIEGNLMAERFDTEPFPERRISKSGFPGAF